MNDTDKPNIFSEKKQPKKEFARLTDEGEDNKKQEPVSDDRTHGTLNEDAQNNNKSDKYKEVTDSSGREGMLGPADANAIYYLKSKSGDPNPEAGAYKEVQSIDDEAREWKKQPGVIITTFAVFPVLLAYIAIQTFQENDELKDYFHDNNRDECQPYIINNNFPSGTARNIPNIGDQYLIKYADTPEKDGLIPIAAPHKIAEESENLSNTRLISLDSLAKSGQSLTLPIAGDSTDTTIYGFTYNETFEQEIAVYPCGFNEKSDIGVIQLEDQQLSITWDNTLNPYVFIGQNDEILTPASPEAQKPEVFLATPQEINNPKSWVNREKYKKQTNPNERSR